MSASRAGLRGSDGHQLDAGAGVGVHVGLAAEVLDQVDDDLHATGIGDLELLGPDSDGDLLQTRVERPPLVALELQRRITDLHAVRGDRRGHQVHRGEPMKPATNALAGRS